LGFDATSTSTKDHFEVRCRETRHGTAEKMTVPGSIRQPSRTYFVKNCYKQGVRLGKKVFYSMEYHRRIAAFSLNLKSQGDSFDFWPTSCSTFFRPLWKLGVNHSGFHIVEFERGWFDRSRRLRRR